MNQKTLRTAQSCLSLFFSFILLSLVFTGRAYAATYYPSGTVVSADLLQGQSEKSIDKFGYNASSIPAGTNLKVQFSKDGTTWKNSSGTTDGWDTLSEGDHTAEGSAINLSGLNWLDVNLFYYKMQFETSYTAATPVLDDILLYYTPGNNFTTQYYTSGTLVSTNLLSGQTVANINTFAYNLSARPAGTAATIQFSQNATTWYNSSGASGGTNTLNSGSNSINLTPLNWSGANFYYKIQFTGAGSSTPVLDDITVTINNAIVTVPNADSVDLDRGLAAGFTVDTWVKVASSAAEEANGQIFNKGTNTWLRVTNKGPDGKADLEASLDLATTDATVTITDGIDINKWTHIAMSYTGSQIKIYINGTLRGTSINGSGAPASDSNALLIGGTTGAHFHGFIDEFKIFPFERTASQVKTSTASKIPSVHGISASAGDDQSYLSNGLVGYWKMDDGVNNPCASGVDKACDSSGNGNVGTWTGNVASASGKFGNGTTYDGTGDYIEVADSDTLEGLSGITIGAWIKPTALASTQDIIQKENTYNFRITATAIECYVYNGSNWYKVANALISNLTADTWAQVTCSWTADGDGRIYVNGSNVTAASVTATAMATNTNVVRIGSRVTTEYFTGKIDEVRIYNRALSPSEVTRLYDWAPGPVGWWKMDENTGATANDSSGNANDGTLTNSPSWTRGKFGSALNFNGVNNYVAIPASSVFDNQTITINSWVYSTNFNQNGFIFEKTTNGSVNTQYSCFFSGTNLKFRTYNNSSTQNDLTLAWSGWITNNAWNHIACVYDGANKYIYINGVLATSAAYTQALITNPAGTSFIGEYAGGGYWFNGKIDDVRVYNYARTSKQIVSDMNAGHPAVGSPVGSAVGKWDFEEGQGLTAHSSGSCGATCSGTLTYMASPATGSSGWTNNGKFGKALNFDGVDDYVLVTDTEAIRSSSVRTVDFWMKASSIPADALAHRLIYEADGTTNNTYQVVLNPSNNDAGNNSNLEVNVAIGGTITDISIPDNSIRAGQWYHVVVVWDSTPVIQGIYLNGVAQTLTTQANNSISSVANAGLTIGARGDLIRFFSGSLDAIRLYDYPLNAQEVKVEYNQGKAVVMGALSTNPDGSATNSAARAYCPPGDAGSNCAAGMDPSPVGEWKFDERTGTSAFDTSGNNNTGTLTNGPIWTTGKIGSALKFDGVDDYVDAGNGSSLNFERTNAFSISGWIKTTSTAASVFSKMANSDPFTGYDLTIDAAGKLALLLSNTWSSNAIRLTSSQNVNDGTWKYVTATYDGSSDTAGIKIYINGIQDTAATSDPNSLTSGSIQNSLPVTIGSRQQSRYINGSIDDVRVYNYARTQAQVAWDYNRGKPIAWWKFDECADATAHDASGNGNDGTITLGASGQTTAGNCTTNTNTPWYNGRNGKFNSALNFDGVDDYVDAGNADILNTRNDLTVSFWAKLDSSSTPDQDGEIPFISKKQYGGYHNNYTLYNIVYDNSSKKILTIFGSGSVDSWMWGGTALNLNSWYHITVTKKGTSAKIYLNGLLDADTNIAFSTLYDSSANSLWIGKSPAYSSYGYFNGAIDDVRVYNYALTSQQIKLLYNEDSALRFGPLTGSP